MPVMSIPIKRGNVVSDIKKPPKSAATVSTTKPNKRPPGAADGPIMHIAMNQTMNPEMNEKRLSAHRFGNGKFNSNLYVTNR